MKKKYYAVVHDHSFCRKNDESFFFDSAAQTPKTLYRSARKISGHDFKHMACYSIEVFDTEYIPSCGAYKRSLLIGEFEDYYLW